MNGIARRLRRHCRIPGLVPAVSAWTFAKGGVPLEVGARHLRGFYHSDEALLDLMRGMIYGQTGYYDRGHLRLIEIRQLLNTNSTLRAVSRLCRRSLPEKRGVRSVITYNYDDFLEKSLGKFPHQSAWKAAHIKPGRLPIYHVHGFVPARANRGSSMDEIVLTEDQYNQAAQDPYSWADLVQLHALSGSVGLMVGLSVSDRNLRRILDALRQLPRRGETFALLCQPKPRMAQDADLDVILDEMKSRVLHGFEHGYGEQPMELLGKADIRFKISKMVRDLEALNLRQNEAVLRDLGIHPIWYENHEEIEKLLQLISQKSKTGLKGEALKA